VKGSAQETACSRPAMSSRLTNRPRSRSCGRRAPA
jgi:hypothetical protein